MIARVVSATGASRIIITGDGMQIEVAARDGWRPVGNAGPLVSGTHFDLVPSSIVEIDNRAELEGTSAAGSWTASVVAVPGTGWLHFLVDLDCEGITLDGV